MLTPLTQDTDAVQIINDGLSFRWNNGGRIGVFIWHNMSRDTVDRYVTFYHQRLGLCNDKCVLDLYDFRYKGFGLTPYMRAAIASLTKITREQGYNGRLALLLEQKGISMQVVQYYMHAMSLVSGGMVTRMFFDYDDAMRWLQEL